MAPKKNPAAYVHLTLSDRIEIERGLRSSRSIRSIAATLGKAPSTISREIYRNRRDDGYRRNCTITPNRCMHRASCEVRHLCQGCSRLCRVCTTQRCANACRNYREEICRRHRGAPWVCTGCKRHGGCTLRRWAYSAESAHKLAQSRFCETQTGIFLDAETLAAFDAYVTPLIRKGQSLAHIYHSDPSRFPVSLRTTYLYVERGYLGAVKLDLIRAVKYKRGEKVTARKAKEHLGHTYADFCALSPRTQKDAIEMDCVCGAAKDTQVLLTLHHRPSAFMFIFLLAAQTQAEVARALTSFASLSSRPIAAAGLTDKGAEFWNMGEIEEALALTLYYCDSYSAWQKGACERNHEYIRRVLPKGTSFKDLTKADVALLCSHINSTKRDSLGGRSPFEVAYHYFEEEVFEGAGLRQIDPREVLLKPALVK